MSLQSLSEIESAASALGNQLSAGINIREAVARMARLQPKHAEVWQAAAESISRGNRLSDQLTEVWPEAVVAALRAGEESGTIDQVLTRTAMAVRVRLQVRKVYGKLLSPAISFGAGVGVLLFFMIAVIPKIAGTLGGGEKSLVFKAAILMNYIAMNYWPVVAAGVAVVGYMAVIWFKTPENMDKLVAMGNSQARLGAALRSLYFGTWAYQMALLDAAGLPIKQQLQLSVKTLPECYREGVALMASEVEKRGIADAADPDKQIEGDPRREWPFYVATAFITAHETGRVDQEMERCAPILVEEGIKQLTQVIGVADLFAKMAAAGMISMPLMAYFTQLANSLTKSFS